MSCNLTTGFVLDCRDSVGGIKEIYIGELDNKETLSATSGVIDTFTMASSSQFYTYEVRKQTSNATETVQASDENGTSYFEQAVTVQLSKMEAAKRNEMFLLAKARTMLIALDRNGKYWLYGENNGLTLGGSGQTGTAMGDLNGYTLTFAGAEESPAQEVSGSLISTLTAPAL